MSVNTACLTAGKEDILKQSSIKKHSINTAALYCRLSRDDNVDNESNASPIKGAFEKGGKGERLHRHPVFCGRWDHRHHPWPSRLQ